jgi:hypothetical protein
MGHAEVSRRLAAQHAHLACDECSESQNGDGQQEEDDVTHGCFPHQNMIILGSLRAWNLRSMLSNK